MVEINQSYYICFDYLQYCSNAIDFSMSATATGFDAVVSTVNGRSFGVTLSSDTDTAADGTWLVGLVASRLIGSATRSDGWPSATGVTWGTFPHIGFCAGGCTGADCSGKALACSAAAYDLVVAAGWRLLPPLPRPLAYLLENILKLLLIWCVKSSLDLPDMFENISGFLIKNRIGI